jgi:hypothetical protein
VTRKELVNIQGVKNRLNFGKYKDKTILQVIEENPAYIVWCIRNVKNFTIDDNLSKELCKQYDEHFRKYNQTQANGYTNNDVQRLMRKYNMHATEAMDFLEYDVFEYY